MKKKLWILFFCLLLFTVYQLVDIYALLESRGSATASPIIGKWEITVNGLDVALNKEITINDLIYKKNENVEPGYFAPGVEANYDIVINPNDTDVAIRYDITVDLGAIINHPNITFDMSVDGILKKDEYTYSGIIPLSSINAGETTTIKTSLIWEHIEKYNNEDSSLINGEIPIKLTIYFSQYTGEEL